MQLSKACFLDLVADATVASRSSMEAGSNSPVSHFQG
jgi:hypothetical protein